MNTIGTKTHLIKTLVPLCFGFLIFPSIAQATTVFVTSGTSWTVPI